MKDKIKDTSTWMNELEKIISEYKNGSEESLDGDETANLASIILAKIDLHEGNITEDEYFKVIFRYRELIRDWEGIGSEKDC